MKKVYIVIFAIIFLFSSLSCVGRTPKNKEVEYLNQSIADEDKAIAKISGHFTKEEIENLQCEPLYSHRAIYGKTIKYLGQTTIDEQDQIYIQSSEFVNLEELREGYVRGDNFYVDLIALNVQPNEEPMSWYKNDPCEEIWSYRIPRTRIGNVCFNENNVYVGTTEGPDSYTGDTYCIICLDKKTGKEIWKRQVNSPMLKEPIIIDGTLYYVEKGTLCAVDPSNGNIKWEYIGNFTSLIYDNGMFYYASGVKLYSFSLSKKEETLLGDWIDPLVSEACTLQGGTNMIKVGSLLCKADHLA